ncbi:MAG: sulfatase-like hydrolase/transferase [Acidobacteriaceae bacterium]|nr:sulfatase-like hydrolase/transferase [Acidobacteriaceae bacterium]
MKRRDFLRSTAAITGGGLLAGYDSRGQNTAETPVPGPKPNIMFILVDELRFPTVFPDGIQTPGEFLARFMPNVHKLWRRGVKFGNYHTAANACTPARGVIITGLYSHQSWLLATILSTPYPPAPPPKQPVLNPLYPTFGKLLRKAGYRTPYTGKWHASVPQQDKGGLEPYGFHFFTYYDPTGTNLQGTYGDEVRDYHNDSYSAGQAVDWLQRHGSTVKPWCLTVSLVNPHDREFFPAGTEFKTVTNLFDSSKTNPQSLEQVVKYPGDGPVVSWQENALKSPPSYKYQAVPQNWESRDTLSANKPSTQVFVHDLQQAVWGGIADDASQADATIEEYPPSSVFGDLGLGIAKMPYSYWKRGMDSYTQIMQIVDTDIGGVLDAFETLPQDVVENTIIVFAADHGEYSGAHGMPQGKLGTVYEEALHIPLIVVDPSNRFTGDIEEIRMGLTSSVDLMPLLVSLGYNGTRDWMRGPLAEIYGERHDMISMLKSADAPGRPYVLFATDEVVPDYINFNLSPTNVLGLLMEDAKLGVYAKWYPLTSKIINSSVELEYYDYSTRRGRLELDNIAKKNPQDPRIQAAYSRLMNDLIPNELQKRLPPPLRAAQAISKEAHLIYRSMIQDKPPSDWQRGDLVKVLGYGANF